MALRMAGSTLQAARLIPGPRPRVAAWYEAAWDGQEIGQLQRLAHEWRLDRCRCGLVLGSEDYQIAQVEAPRVAAGELKDALRWRAKEFLDYPVEEAAIDVAVIPSDHAARAPAAFVVSARRATLSALAARFGAAGVRLAVIDIPEMAQRNLAARFEAAGRGLAFLAFDAGAGLLTFTCHGELIQSRRMENPFRTAEAGAFRPGAPALERLTLELQRSLDHFDRQYSSIPLSRLLLGPMDGAEDVAQLLGEQLALPVAQAALDDALDLAGVPEAAHATGALLTLGAALREVPAS